MKTAPALQVVSTFDCSPLQIPLTQESQKAGLAEIIRTAPSSQITQHMISPSPESEDIIGTIVVVRLEDWLREQVSASGPISDVSARQLLRSRLDEFLNHLAVLALRGRPVWLLICPSNGWIAHQYKLATLCRTMANLLSVRSRNLSQVAVLAWPSSLNDSDSFDKDADKAKHFALSSSAYAQLAESLAMQLSRWMSTYNPNAIVTSAGTAELVTFLDGLHVTVVVKQAAPEHAEYVAKILRTAASFSMAGEKPLITESEVDTLISSGNCYLVTVGDRLCSHGPSGVLVTRAESGALVVESLSLSCTVLGKQVEFAVLSALEQYAATQDRSAIVFEYRPSGRNQPMATFLSSVADADHDGYFRVSVEELNSRIQRAATNPTAWNLTIG